MKFTEEAFAPHMRPITGSAIREIFKLLGKPGMISFAGGNPSNAALEPEVISELAVEDVYKRQGYVHARRVESAEWAVLYADGRVYGQQGAHLRAHTLAAHRRGLGAGAARAL